MSTVLKLPANKMIEELKIQQWMFSQDLFEDSTVLYFSRFIWRFIWRLYSISQDLFEDCIDVLLRLLIKKLVMWKKGNQDNQNFMTFFNYFPSFVGTHN